MIGAVTALVAERSHYSMVMRTLPLHLTGRPWEDDDIVVPSPIAKRIAVDCCCPGYSPKSAARA